MEEDISLQLQEVNQKLSPILGELLDGVDYKTVIIYFAGLTKNLMEELNDDNFKKVIIAYISDGDNNVTI